MTIALTTPIQNPWSFPRITKIKVVRADNEDELTPPRLCIRLRLTGPGDVHHADQIVCAYDEQASTCLRKKVTPQSQADLVETYGASITGLYTRLLGALAANVTNPATHAKHLKALEDDLIPSGIISSDFIGT